MERAAKTFRLFFSSTQSPFSGLPPHAPWVTVHVRTKRIACLLRVAELQVAIRGEVERFFRERTGARRERLEQWQRGGAIAVRSRDAAAQKLNLGCTFPCGGGRRERVQCRERLV